MAKPLDDGAAPLSERGATLAQIEGNGRFEVRSPLGTGGMGEVFEVFDRERGMRLALKVLRSLRADALLRFKEEFRALGDVHHPNLIGLGELVEVGGLVCFTMELLEGTDFLTHVRFGAAGAKTGADSDDAPTTTGGEIVDDTIVSSALEDGLPSSTTIIAKGRSRGATRGTPAPLRELDERRLRAALSQLATGLAALHRAGIVHRDVKPSNVWVEPDDRVVILDFGLAAAAESQSDANFVVGTATHMAPEQAAGAPPTPSMDWYAMGVVLFQALTGRLPFQGPRRLLLRAKMEEDAPRVRDLRPDAPGDLAALCDRLLDRDPARRPDEDELLMLLDAERPDAWVGLSPLTAVARGPFVGREAELERLLLAHERVQSGHPVAVWVTGPSGIGKSRLVHELCERIVRAEPRTLVLEGRCHEKESLRFKAVDGVVDGLSRHLATRSEATAVRAMPDHLPALLTVFPALSSVPTFAASHHATETAVGGDPALRRARAFSALRALLSRLAFERPVVMILDDFQWADADSVALIQHLFDGEGSPPLLLLGLLRERATGSIEGGLRGEASRYEAPPLNAEIRHLPLLGLARSDARQLIERLKGKALADELVERWVDETGGHPMLLDELAHGSTASTAVSGPLRLEDALLARAGALDPASRALLDAVCVGGVPLPQGVMAEIAALSPAEFAERSGLLRATRLARIAGVRPSDTIEPFHDRVRAAIYDAIPQLARASLHQRLGEALAKRPGFEDQAAFHLLRAGERDRSAAFFERAAVAARAVLAFERAASLYAEALAHGAQNEARQRALIAARAECLRNAGHADRAATLYRTAAGHGSPSDDERAELLRRAGELWLASGHLAPGLEVTNHLLERFGMRVPASPTKALASLLVVDARLGLRSLEPKLRPDEAIGDGDRLCSDVLWSTSAGLSLVRPLHATILAARGALHALSLGDPLRMTRALCACVVADHGIGRVARAERLHDVARRAATARPSERADFYLRWADVGRDYLTRNDFRAVVRSVSEAEVLFRRFGEGHAWELDSIRQFAHWALDHLGAQEELRGVVAERIRWARSVGNRFVEVAYRTWFVHPALADDRPDELLADIDDALASWLPEDTSFSNPEYLALRSRIYTSLYEGHPERLEASLRTQWKRYTRSLTGRVVLCREEGLGLMTGLELLIARNALDEHQSGDARAALSRARRGVRALSSGRLPVTRVTLRLRRAALAYIEGRTDVAEQCLATAIEDGEALGLGLVTAAAKAVHGSILGGDEGKRLKREALTYLRDRRFRRPDRLVAAILPGFGHPG
jgi:serine/threonine protein kinase/tetratricopeptide (TPR) repeat protein